MMRNQSGGWKRLRTVLDPFPCVWMKGHVVCSLVKYQEQIGWIKWEMLIGRPQENESAGERWNEGTGGK